MLGSIAGVAKKNEIQRVFPGATLLDIGGDWHSYFGGHLARSSMSHRVLLLTRYPHLGASSRIRFLQYLPGLKDYGIDVEVLPFWDEAYLRRLYAGEGRRWSSLAGAWLRRLARLCRGRHYDVIWVEKEIVPWLPSWIGNLLVGKMPMVLDFDDLWHLRYGEIANPLARWFLRDQLEDLTRRAAVVTVANPYLEAWATAAGAREVVNVPSSIDLDRYEVVEAPRDAPFTIGWIGTPETLPYLADIAVPLQHILAKPGVKLLVIGASSFSLPGVEVELHEWSFDTEIELLQKINVGIMPLRRGSWEEGKSGFKLLQYMAVGRPVVATPVGISKLLVRDGSNGFLAASDEEWIASIERLREDPDLAVRLGNNARLDVAQSYSMAEQLPKIANVLKTAAANPPGLS